MADISITTDGTIKGTKLSVDGKDVTKKEKVVSISMYASAPYKSRYSGETIQGYAQVSYETMADGGKVERKSYGTSDTQFMVGIGQKIKSNDSVIRFVGAETDAEVSDLVDRIVSHCEEAKIPCPTKDALLSRTVESLKDKAEDLGIKMEDQEAETETEEETDGGEDGETESEDATQKITGRTSMTNGHSHAYSYDSLGFGTTSVAAEHKHAIRNKVVQPAKGHIHKIGNKK